MIRATRPAVTLHIRTARLTERPLEVPPGWIAGTADVWIDDTIGDTVGAWIAGMIVARTAGIEISSRVMK
jgi:hypothetical protein